MTPKPGYERFFSIHPSPTDWINDMTVCVAGITSEESIIAMCDMMVSTASFSADSMALKFRDLDDQWKVMFAGNDVSRILPLIEHAREMALSKRGPLSLAGASECMKSAFQEQLIEKQTDLVLARYGLSMPQFLKEGLDSFGEQTFGNIKYQLDRIELECAFLVFGSDGDGQAHIFTVEDPGIICNHDLYGFWAIGSGANRALSSLFFQEYRKSLPEWRAIYHVSEAKFMAEGGSVGARTLVMIKRRNHDLSVGSLDFEIAKKLWNRKGRPKVPKEAKNIIAKSLESEFFPLTMPSDSEKSE